MTPATLKEYTLKDLAQMAKKRGILGWHSMRKDDLIRAIVREDRRAPQRSSQRSAQRGAAAKHAARLTSSSLAGSAKLRGSKSVGAKTGAGQVTSVKAVADKTGAAKVSATKLDSAKTSPAKASSAKAIGTKLAATTLAAKALGSAKTNGLRPGGRVALTPAVMSPAGSDRSKDRSGKHDTIKHDGPKHEGPKHEGAANGAGRQPERPKLSKSRGRSVLASDDAESLRGPHGTAGGGNGRKVTGSGLGQARPDAMPLNRNSGVNGTSHSRSTVRPKPAAPPQRLSAVARKIQKVHQELEQFKNLAGNPAPLAPPAKPNSSQDRTGNANGGHEPGTRDRVVLMVRDPYWLHVHWELSTRSVQRAQAAMAEYWHTSKPVIRLMEVASKGTTTSTEMFVRDVEIHGGVNNWYIDVLDPPRGYRVEIGYLASNGRFHGLARSNCVETPQPGVRDTLDHTWVDVAENCERIFALSGGYSGEGSTEELQQVLEERLCRPVGNPLLARFGAAADLGFDRDGEFTLDVDAEMVVFGSTRPGAHVTLGGEPIKLRDDGSFAVRMALPDRRQVLPITSSSRDGMMQQTVVLAVERNTKVMEAVTRDTNE